ncbi:hypothetical protein ABMD26_002451 [Pseudomonas sp. PvP001]
MLAPKAFLDALSDHASRLLSGDTAQPRAELESQFKALLQSGFSKLDLVSREEFDSQMVCPGAYPCAIGEPGSQSRRDGSQSCTQGRLTSGVQHVAGATAPLCVTPRHCH